MQITHQPPHHIFNKSLLIPLIRKLSILYSVDVLRASCLKALQLSELLFNAPARGLSLAEQAGLTDAMTLVIYNWLN